MRMSSSSSASAAGAPNSASQTARAPRSRAFFIRSTPEAFGRLLNLVKSLAAYAEDGDRFLILDVSRYKYPPVWIEAEALFAAMDTPDSDNDNKSRGFVIVSR